MTNEVANTENTEVTPNTEAAVTPVAEVQVETPEIKPEKKDGFQKAIDRQTRKYYEQKARADALEAQIKQTKEPLANPNAAVDRSKFETEDEYIVALVDQRAEKIAEAKLAKAKQAEAASAVKSKWDKDALAVKKEVPEFDEVFQDFMDSGHLTPAVDRAILESERPAAVVNYLANNPDEAAKLSGLSDFRVAIEIGKIEVKLATPGKKISNAPAPITPVGAKGAVGGIDPEKESPKEFAARRNKELAEKRKR